MSLPQLTQPRAVSSLAVAVVLLGGLASGVGTASVLGPLLAVIVASLVAYAAFRSESAPLTPLVVVAAVGLGALSPYLWATTYWNVALGVTTAGLVTYLIAELSPRTSRYLLPIYVVTAASILMVAMPGSTIDVWFLHQAAGDTVTSGGNPWTDLEIPTGAPESAEEVIRGYPYPPLVLGLYAVLGSMVGEPRLITVVAWLSVALVFAVVDAPDRNTNRAGWLIVIHPSWALMLWAGWTEPLSLGLAVISWAAWRSHRHAASFVFGAVLASKQYFAGFGAWVLGTAQLDRRQKFIVVGAIVVLVASAAVWGAPSAIEALVSFHSRQDPRSDGLSLYALASALGWSVLIPSWLAPAVSTVFAFVLARRDRTEGSPWLSLAAMLSLFFVLGSQAFANYWFMVFALVLLSAATPSRTEPTPGFSRPRSLGGAG